MSPSRWYSWLLIMSFAAIAGVTGATIAKSTSPGPPRSEMESGSQTEIVSALLAANDSLRGEMGRLDRGILASQSRDGPGRLEEMASSLNTLRVVNGAVAAVGPGLRVQISGEFSAAAVRDLVNELKSAGAEVIAIDGRRLTVWSSVYQGGQGVLVDGALLGDQATMEAIGDVGMMRESLERRGGLVALLKEGGTRFVLTERTGAEEIRVPVYPDAKVLTYARLAPASD